MQPQDQPPHGEGPLPLADRYRALARVGIGGTAVVYRCVDLHTGHLVAVKVLRTNGPLIPEAEARFGREARMAARLSHPHIVRVLDFGYTIALPLPGRVPWSEDADRPVPYLAMEYVTGSTLKDLIRQQGPMPLDWVWRIGEQLCAALAVAHEHQIVHRDVKPQNVLILNSRVELLAKLTDFGIARQTDGNLTTLTASGQVLGTPDYLSPEQVLGEAGGPQADLYSLGIVLFEMTTGRLPFEADTPLAAASRRMVEEAPPVTLYRDDVPASLEQVIAAALQRETHLRFASMRELGEALRWSRAQAGSVPTPPKGSWVLVKRPAKSLLPRTGGNTTPNAASHATPPTTPPAAEMLALPEAPAPMSVADDLAPGDPDLQTTILRVAPIPRAPADQVDEIPLAIEPVEMEPVEMELPGTAEDPAE